MKTSVARRSRMSSGAAGDAERHAVRIRRGADGRVRRQHKGITFDKNLIAASEVGVGRFQIEDLIGRGVGAGREDGSVIAAFRVNSRARKTQLDVCRKCPAPGDIWSGTYQIEA